VPINRVADSITETLLRLVWPDGIPVNMYAAIPGVLDMAADLARLKQASRPRCSRCGSVGVTDDECPCEPVFTGIGEFCRECDESSPEICDECVENRGRSDGDQDMPRVEGFEG